MHTFLHLKPVPGVQIVGTTQRDVSGKKRTGYFIYYINSSRAINSLKRYLFWIIKVPLYGVPGTSTWTVLLSHFVEL